MVGNDDDTFGNVGGREIAGIGGFVVGCVVAGLVIGWLVDDHWASSPVGILIGLGVGIVVAIVGSCLRIAHYLRR